MQNFTKRGDNYVIQQEIDRKVYALESIRDISREKKSKFVVVSKKRNKLSKFGRRHEEKEAGNYCDHRYVDSTI
jgi:hypothetical protein